MDRHINKLVDCVARAITDDDEESTFALKELVEIASVLGNRATLAAHPRLVPAIVKRIAASFYGNCELELEFISNLANDDSLCRSLYLCPGLVEALMKQYEVPAGKIMLCKLPFDVLRKLVTDTFQNKLDFVRQGYPMRIARMLMSNPNSSSDVAVRAGMVFYGCIATDAYGRHFTKDHYDALREEFFRTPGLMDTILRQESCSTITLKVLTILASIKSISVDMLALPGLVDDFLLVHRNGLLLPVLLNNDPRGALKCPGLIAKLVTATKSSKPAEAEYAQRCLVDWYIVLHPIHSSSSEISFPIDNVAAVTAGLCSNLMIKF